MTVKLIYLSSVDSMQIKILFLFFTLPFLSISQLTDDFSDGDFLNNLEWNGSTEDYIINSDQKLQLNNSEAATSYLSTPHYFTSIEQKEWHIWTKQSFSPSSSNNGRIYLTADNPDLSITENGYYIQLGESGSNDALRLFKLEDGVSTLLCSGSDGQIASSFQVSIKVTYDGVWSLYTDFTGGTDYNLESSSAEANSFVGSHFGFIDTYTVSNSTKFYYDDIYLGDMIIDTEAPLMTEVSVISPTQIDIFFNESLDEVSSTLLSNYEIQPSLGINSVSLDGSNSSLIHMNTVAPLQNGSTYTLSSTNIEDLSGNTSQSQSISFDYLIGENAVEGDLIITEVFADPTPAIGLPECEFIEIYNASNKIINLYDWKIQDASSSGTISEGWIMPNTYMLLTSTSNIDSFNISNLLSVVSFPSLNNSSDDVKLLNIDDVIIDEISYTDDWYGDDIKKLGGYSLERINPNDPCSDRSNWSASEASTGGSPGIINSVFDETPDLTAPSISEITVLPPSYIEVNFNEGMDSTSLVGASINTSPMLSVQNIFVANEFSKQMIVEFNENIQAGVLHNIYIENIQDCWLNSSTINSTFVRTENGEIGDLVINEFVSNPYSDGEDWIEIYNNSEKYIDLYGWGFANYDDTISNFEGIDDHYILYPNNYVVISEDTTFIKQYYPASVAGNFLTSDLPTYSNDSGSIYFIHNLEVIDQLSYNKDWHFDLIDDTDGVSLERIDPNGTSNDAFNWHSAAEDIGFGTPGRINSQYIPAVYNGKFSFSNSVFSPDNDGFEDVLMISYQMNQEGLLGQVSIYDDKGRVIKHLFDNKLLGTIGSFTWDGTTNEGVKASIGVYVMLFEAFSTDGSVFFTKLKAFTLAGKI